MAKVTKKKTTKSVIAPPPTTHVVSVVGSCSCPKTVTVNLPALPVRLHVTKVEMYCHECKQVFNFIEAT